MTLVFALGTALYALLLAAAILALLVQKSPHHTVIQGISVIIPARDEAHNLPRLLNSLADIVYPEYEVIIVNDHSTDASLELLKPWDGRHKIKVIDFQDTLPGLIGKKAALQKGIDAAQYEILTFTDADCAIPSTWLDEINRRMDPQTDYLLGYSTIKRFEGDRELRLQNFERSVYYALAAAGLYYRLPITSSACNMAYRKSVFIKAGGFEGIGHLRSGDDDLLLMKMMPFIRKAVYNPSPRMQITSIAGNDPLARHHTNVRRASKFRHYPLYLKALALYAFSYYLAFYLALIGLFWLKGGACLWYALVIKTSAELCLVLLHLRKIGKLQLGALYPLQLLLFPAQFVFYAVRGTIGGYRWK